MKKVFELLVFLIVSSLSVFAQTEFFVNSTFRFAQRDPQIARDSSGNYGVVWKSVSQIDSASKGDIYLQFFNSKDQMIGSEVLVNTTTIADQDKPAIAMNDNGDLIITWASHSGFNEIYDIKARIFKNRSPIGNEFLVNTTTNNSQTNPAVAIDSSGFFIIVWDSWNQDGSDKGIYAQQFSNAGLKFGNEFRVNTTTQYSQAKPAIKFFRNGKFIIIWESWKQDETSPAGYGVYGRIFEHNGAPSVNEFQINTYVNDYQWYADVATFSNNSFAVVWCSWEQDGSDGGIYFQRFNANAEKIGKEILVNQTTTEYQWLPKIRAFSNNNFAVLWSSWKQDGNREGIYGRIFDENGNPISFESKINDYTQNFQWEPDFIVNPSNEMMIVWSSWGKTNNDYDIVAKRFAPTFRQGYFSQSLYEHTSGISTSKFIVHRIDSTKITGHQYELSFDSLSLSNYTARIIDLTDGDTVVSNLNINRGEKTFYLTNVFDGVAVEIVPELDLNLDFSNSYTVNTSGSDAIFSIAIPTIGTKLIAPIDIVCFWGSSDTTVDGQFQSPLDTAINISGQAVVKLPFKVWNITDKSKITLLVADGNNNKRFDFGERIIALTPPKYRKAANNSHVQITNLLSKVGGKWPTTGDSIFIFTTRPLAKNDRFRFTTDQSTVLQVAYQHTIGNKTFELHQNYPNPFNPSTTIKYSLERSGRVRLSVYNVLGQRVKLLVDEFQEEHNHKISFNADNLSAGVYFYILEMNNQIIAKKMILLK